METYFIEMIDTYGGEANYCWVNRFLVTAKSFTHAISKVTRKTGYKAHCVGDFGDTKRYDVRNCAICYFVSYAEGNELDQYSRIEVI